MKLFVILFLLCFLSGVRAVESVNPPECLASEPAIKDWVEKTVHDAPPAGGDITMLKYFPLKYSDNEQVGKIWIITAVCRVRFEGKSDHKLVFLVYHCETGKGEIEMLFPIPENSVNKYLKMEPVSDGNQAFFVPPPPQRG